MNSPKAAAALQVNLLGYRLRITGPEREIETLKGSLFTRCQEPPEAEPHTVYRIEVDGEEYRVIETGREKSILFHSKKLDDIFWDVEYALLCEALDRNNDLIQIHGAAVERDGKALVFLGDSYVGKSTMTLHLIRQGYRFLSDEVVLIDPASGRLKPFPRNLLVRQGALESDAILNQLREGRWRYNDKRGETKWLVDPGEVGAIEEPQEAMVERIYCLKRDEDAGPLLEPLGSRMAIEEMLGQSFNNEHMGKKGVEALIQIATSSQTFRLRAPHGGVAWELLRAHLNLPEK